MAKYRGKLPNLNNLAGDLVASVAINCAWPHGTPRAKYTYPTGRPTNEYRKTLNKAYGSRSGWGAQTKAGASCDVFVGACVRASGLDKAFPRGLDGNPKHIDKHPELFKKTKAQKAKSLKNGDIIFELYKGGGGHISVVVEVGGEKYIAEAGYNTKRYPVIAHEARNYNTSNYKTFGVYRPQGGRKYLKEGDISDQVALLQAYLNFKIGKKLKKLLTIDRGYGPKTAEAVKIFQKAYKLEDVDGIWGSECQKKAESLEK